MKKDKSFIYGRIWPSTYPCWPYPVLDEPDIFNPIVEEGTEVIKRIIKEKNKKKEKHSDKGS
jgi:hypothetical protein